MRKIIIIHVSEKEILHRRNIDSFSALITRPFMCSILGFKNYWL